MVAGGAKVRRARGCEWCAGGWQAPRQPSALPRCAMLPWPTECMQHMLARRQPRCQSARGMGQAPWLWAPAVPTTCMPGHMGLAPLVVPGPPLRRVFGFFLLSSSLGSERLRGGRGMGGLMMGGAQVQDGAGSTGMHGHAPPAVPKPQLITCGRRTPTPATAAGSGRPGGVPERADCAAAGQGGTRRARWESEPPAFVAEPGCRGIVMTDAIMLPDETRDPGALTSIGVASCFLCPDRALLPRPGVEAGQRPCRLCRAVHPRCK